jgi:hypothetical protein
MSGPLIIIVGLIYLAVAAAEGVKGHTGWALMYVSYAVANVGTLLAMRNI